VTVNGVAKGTFSPTNRLVVYGQGGNDTITVDSRISISRLMYGGDGADAISGGNGNGIQVGGDGNDTLSAGNSRDIQIGGTGADTLRARTATTSSSPARRRTTAAALPSQSALCAIAKEWNRTDAGYTTRVAHLTGSTSGGLNGASKLTTTGAGRTALDDASKDSLTGGMGQDWYLLNKTGGTVLDTSDATSSEVRTDL
jgi:Ca2+-binding RTX toxin-like protein